MGASRRRPPRTYYEVAGIDLERELRWLCALPVLGGEDGPLAKDPPTLRIRRASARPRRNLGFAVPAERRISVTAYPGIRAGDAQEVLLHELVHIAVGRTGGRWHGAVFRRMLAEAMRQAYGVKASGPASIHGTYAEALERRRRLVQTRRAGLHPEQLALDAA